MGWTADDAREKYGEDGGYFYPTSYDPIIESLGDEILRVEDDDYQGDTRVLLHDEPTGRWGIVIIGWGSCSGCDALQACRSAQEVAELRDDIASIVHWEPTAEDLLRYVLTKDWELGWAWHSDATRKFVDEVKRVLAQVSTVPK